MQPQTLLQVISEIQQGKLDIKAPQNLHAQFTALFVYYFIVGYNFIKEFLINIW